MHAKDSFESSRSSIPGIAPAPVHVHDGEAPPDQSLNATPAASEPDRARGGAARRAGSASRATRGPRA